METPDWTTWAAKLASLAEGSVPSNPADLTAWKAFLENRRSLPFGHPEAARLCESAGLIQLALQEWQITLRDHPQNPEAMHRLALLHRDRGELPKAKQMLTSLLALNPNDSLAHHQLLNLQDEERALAGLHLDDSESNPNPFNGQAIQTTDSAKANHSIDPNPPFAFSDTDCARFVSIFAGRENLHARQWVGEEKKTGYTPIPEPFTSLVAKNHFQGSITVGIYPIRLDGTCTFFAIDLDINKNALEKAARSRDWAAQLRQKMKSLSLDLLQRLRALGLDPLFEHSGYKGRHFWCFLEQPETASTLHQLGKLLMAWLQPALTPDFHLEFFPKQSELKGKGLGNLIKVPLGLHRRTGHRAHLLDDSGQPLPSPFNCLQSLTRHPRGKIIGLIDTLKTAERHSSQTAPQKETAEIHPKTHETLPQPSRVPMEWTDADFETDQEVSHLLKHCPVLAELKERAFKDRTLTYDEQLILIHTLGHLEAGPAAVNYLLGKCLDVGPEKFMKDRHKGSPTSCPTIRKRIPLITRKLSCCCDFSSTPDRYPTPFLHTLNAPKSQNKLASRNHPNPEVLARNLIATLRKMEELRKEEGDLRDAIIAILRSTASRDISCESGVFQLVEQDGIEELRWRFTQTPEIAKKGD
jgi:hypothetical protein